MSERRLLRLFTAIAALLVIVLGRAFWVQVVAAPDLLRRYDAALRGERVVLPRRGEIQWADGTPAVRNVPRFVVRVDMGRWTACRWTCLACGDSSAVTQPPPAKDGEPQRAAEPPRTACRECGAAGRWEPAPLPDCAALGRVLGVEHETVLRAIEAAAETWRIQRWRAIDLFPEMRIERDAAIRLAMRAAEFPGISVASEPGRETDPEIATIAGRATLAWGSDVEALSSPTRETQGLVRFTESEAARMLVGRSGFERRHDESLRGAPGLVERPPVRDGEDEPEESVIRPVVDDEPVRTTLVRAVQAVANEVVRRPEIASSSAVVLRVSDGAVVALASESDDAYCHAICPLIPGSVFKLVGALATLESGFPADATMACDVTGRLRSGHPYRCSHSHAPVDLGAAFAQSCNHYFMQRAEDMGAAPMLDAYRRLGFDVDVRLGVGVTTKVPRVADFATHTALLGIGQAEAEASPLQVATAYARIASGGRRIVPYIDRSAGPPPESREFDPVLSRHARALIDAARRVVTEGTGRSVAGLAEIDGAGKTGTAELSSGEHRRLNVWFAGFAPASDPQYVAVVVHEKVSRTSGAAIAGPDVARLLEAALRER